MINTLIGTLPRGLNEIFAFCMLLAALIIVFRRNDLRQYIYLLLFSLLVIIVRITFEVDSHRYVAILIYPSCILTAWLCVYLSELKCLQLTTFRFLANTKMMQAIFVTIVVAACIGKIFHLNPYRNHFEESYKIIKKEFDTERQVEVWSLGNDYRRIEYYTGISPRILNNCDIDEIEQMLNDFKLANTTVLIDIQEAVNDRPLSSFLTKNISATAIELIFSSYTNAKKNRKHEIYRFYPKHINADVVSGAIKELHEENNLLKNGDLESILRGNAAAEMLPPHLRDITRPKTDEFKVPDTSFFQIDIDARPGTFTFGCTEKNALCGNNSIFISSEYYTIYFMFKQRFYTGKYSLSAHVKGDKGTAVCLIYHMRQNKKWTPYKIVEFILPDDRVYKISGEFEADVSGDDFFWGGCSVKNGNAIFDNFNLIKIDSDTAVDGT